MDIRNLEIGGHPAVAVRDALRAFNDLPIGEFKDGTFVRHKKVVTAPFLAEQLGIPEGEAADLLASLIDEHYIDASKLTPLTLGMALIGAEDRPRIALSEAKQILEDFLQAVRMTNARPNARVFIEKIFVFGSFIRDADTVGDIDLLLLSPLPEDCMPEDMMEQEQMFEDVNISEYLSFHGEFDPIATAADSRLIYDRSDG